MSLISTGTLSKRTRRSWINQTTGTLSCTLKPWRFTRMQSQNRAWVKAATPSSMITSRTWRTHSNQAKFSQSKWITCAWASWSRWTELLSTTTNWFLWQSALLDFTVQPWKKQARGVHLQSFAQSSKQAAQTRLKHASTWGCPSTSSTSCKTVTAKSDMSACSSSTRYRRVSKMMTLKFLVRLLLI